MSVVSPLAPGSVLGREFEIIRPIGEGGMGTVYEAIQRTTGAPRAIKVMRGNLASDPRFRSRFEQEARVSARIPSDHVVQVVSAGVDEVTHMPWLAMELLEGEDLASRLARTGSMSLKDVRLAAEHLCHGLAAAHSVGVVHRDLKPENIFLGRSRVVGMPFMVKVLDFGVARILSAARQATLAVGTPNFMAPEQTSTSDDLGPTADIWALGLLLYSMLTGRFFWLAASLPDRGIAMLWRELLIDPIPPASIRAGEQGVSVPVGFDSWFAQCVARDPADRFPSVQEAWNELARLLDALTADASVRTPRTGEISGDVKTLAVVYDSTELPLRQGTSSPRPSLLQDSGKPARVTYRDGSERMIVEARRGQTLLEVSVASGVPHYHACGGRARCTTCRVVVLDGQANASPRTEAESRVALARKWPSSIRLACQLRVLGDLTVRRLVVDGDDLAMVNAAQTGEDPVTETGVLLHACLPGFGSFVRDQFPHDAVHVFNRYLQHLCDPALANGGSLVRYQPNGVLFLFPIGQDTAAAVTSAVRTALRMLVRVRQLNPYVLKHFGRAFEVSIGLHLGRLIRAGVGPADRKEAFTFGDGIDGVLAAAQRASDLDVRILATEDLLAAIDPALLRTGDPIALGEQGTGRVIIDFARPDAIFIVQTTFERLGDRADEFAQAFYQALFELNPPLEELFAHVDMTAQRGMLMNVLTTAIRGLEQLEKLVPTLHELGRRHVGYGTRPIHYKFVGQALLQTLETFLGADFTPEVHVAWFEIYGILARTMIEGSTTPEA